MNPKIEIKTSPFADFMGELPNTILSFVQLNQQLEQKERDKNYDLSLRYIDSLGDTREKLMNKLSATQTLSAKSMPTLQKEILQISNRNPEHSTPGANLTVESLGNFYQNEIDFYQSQLTDIDTSQALYREGKGYAEAIDKDFSGGIDEQEWGVFEKNYGDISPSFTLGATAHLNDPNVRKRIREKKTVYNLNEVLTSLESIYPNSSSLKVAREAYQVDPVKNHKMIMEEMKAVRESDADVDIKIEAKIASQAKAFIENENLLNNYIKGVDPDWAANFFAGGTLSTGAKSLESPEAVEGKKASYIQALGMLFSGTSPDGTVDEVVGDPFWFGTGGGTDKIKDIFNAKGGGWGNPEVGVSRVLASSEYQNNIKKKQFDKIINVTGTEQEKLAANEMMQGLDRGLAFLDKMELAQPSLLGADFYKGLNETVDDNLGKGKIKNEDQALIDKHGIDSNQLNAMKEEWSTDKMGQTFDEFLDFSLKQDHPYAEKVAQLNASKQAGVKEEGLAIITAIEKNKNDISDMETQIKTIQSKSVLRGEKIVDLKKNIDALWEAYSKYDSGTGRKTIKSMPKDQRSRYDSDRESLKRLKKIEDNSSDWAWKDQIKIWERTIDTLTNKNKKMDKQLDKLIRIS